MSDTIPLLLCVIYLAGLNLAPQMLLENCLNVFINLYGVVECCIWTIWIQILFQVNICLYRIFVHVSSNKTIINTYVPYILNIKMLWNKFLIDLFIIIALNIYRNSKQEWSQRVWHGAIWRYNTTRGHDWGYSDLCPWPP